jgi:hypothetical protein
MKKLIVFEEEEFNNLLINFAKNFKLHSDKIYGVKLVANETEEDITGLEAIIGSFLLPWNNTFK